MTNTKLNTSNIYAAMDKTYRDMVNSDRYYICLKRIGYDPEHGKKLTTNQLGKLLICTIPEVNIITTMLDTSLLKYHYDNGSVTNGHRSIRAAKHIKTLLNHIIDRCNHNPVGDVVNVKTYHDAIDLLIGTIKWIGCLDGWMLPAGIVDQLHEVEDLLLDSMHSLKCDEVPHLEDAIAFGDYMSWYSYSVDDDDYCGDSQMADNDNSYLPYAPHYGYGRHRDMLTDIADWQFGKQAIMDKYVAASESAKTRYDCCVKVLDTFSTI